MAPLIWSGAMAFVTQRQEKPDPAPHDEVIGVDLGIVNIATDSDGVQFTGEQVRAVRKRYKTQRERLQQVGTPSAKRKLKRVSGKESCFQADINHCVSKALVTKAAISRKALALEDLTGIRDRITVRREHRYERHAWAFYQLRQFLADKADRAGVAVMLVDPRYTSQTCSECHHCEKKNRKSPSGFVCQRCGYTTHADKNAAKNMQWASVNGPLVADFVSATSPLP